MRRHAKVELVHNRPLVCRRSRVAQACGQVYIAVFSGPPWRNDSSCCRRHAQRRDRRLFGHPPRSGLPLAQALFCRSSQRAGKTCSSGSPPDFPPNLVVKVKALACELPAQRCRPLSRWSTRGLEQQLQESGLVASVSGSALWRRLHEDSLRPWYHRG